MTRFYFSPTHAPGITPAVDAGWTNFASGPPRGSLYTEPAGSLAPTRYLQNKTVSTNPTNSGIHQFISSPFTVAGTVNSGTTLRVVLPMGEAFATDDGFIRMVVRIVSNDGTTVRGTLYSGPNLSSPAASGNGLEFTLNTANGETRTLDVTSSSSVAYQVNDRLVVEIGARFASTNTNSVAYAWFTPSAQLAGDYPLAQGVNGLNANVRPWFEVVNVDFYALSTVMAVEEMRYGRDGYALNRDTSTLPFVDLDVIDGLDNAPTRMSQNSREGQHGGFVVAEFEDPRVVTLEGTLYCSPTALETQLQLLKANFAARPINRPLFWKADDGVVYHVMGKSQGLRYRKDRSRSFGAIRFQVQIICEDPRIYTDVDYIVTTAGTITVAGNRETPVIFTVTASASVTNPAVTHTSPMGRTTYTYVGSVVAGDTYQIDVDARTIILNGATNIRGNVGVSPNWNYFYPGSNEITQSTNLTVEKRYKPAWS
jgi:hypothetical protein